MHTTDTVRAILRSRLGAVLAAALSAALLAGCATAGAPGRPHANRPESSNAGTPGTPRGAGTNAGQAGAPRPGPSGGGGQRAGRTTPAGRPSTSGGGRTRGHGIGRGAGAGTAARAPMPAGGQAGTGFLGTASGLFGFGVGRPPGGLGAAFGRPAGKTPRGGARGVGGRGGAGPTRAPAGTAAGGTPAGGTPAGGHGAKPAATRPGSGLKAGAAAGTAGGGRRSAAGTTGSPYTDTRTRALADRLGGAHRLHAGVYQPPPGHRLGAPLAAATDLATLPAWSTLEHLNGYLVSYTHLTPWVASMGVHWGHRGPGLVLMQNENRQVTALETAFPAGAGWHPWYDQPQGKPAGTIYSEHLYFLRPSAITTTMAAHLPADLTSWQAFSAVNAARTAPYKVIGPDPGGRASQRGPAGAGIRVLVDAAAHVVGFVGAWPSNSPQGWRPWFDQRQGAPIQDPVLGSVYTQHLWLVDPRSLPAS